MHRTINNSSARNGASDLGGILNISSGCICCTYAPGKIHQHHRHDHYPPTRSNSTLQSSRTTCYRPSHIHKPLLAQEQETAPWWMEIERNPLSLLHAWGTGIRKIWCFFFYPQH
ncbi:hypothetical protein BDW75DRAFT_16471 [Aspergillus navahoensis]